MSAGMINWVAKIDGQVAMRLREAQDKRDHANLIKDKEMHIYWKGKAEAYKTIRKLTMRPFKKVPNAK